MFVEGGASKKLVTTPTGTEAGTGASGEMLKNPDEALVDADDDEEFSCKAVDEPSKNPDVETVFAGIASKKLEDALVGGPLKKSALAGAVELACDAKECARLLGGPSKKPEEALDSGSPKKAATAAGGALTAGLSKKPDDALAAEPLEKLAVIGGMAAMSATTSDDDDDKSCINTGGE